MSNSQGAREDLRRFRIFRRWNRSGEGRRSQIGRVSLNELAQKYRIPLALGTALLAIALGKMT